jgi:Cu/Ag efflux protein CusF
VGPAQEEKLKELKGVIHAVDSKSGTITLDQMTTGKRHELSLAAKDLPVTDALGRPIKLGDLREELRVIAKLRGDVEAVSLKLDGPYLHGTIRTVDAKKRRITFKHAFGDNTIDVPKEAKVLLSGNASSLEQLQGGAAIQVLYAFDKKSVLQVQSGKGVQARDPYQKVLRYYGVLAEVDHGKRTVQIFLQSTDPGTVKTYRVSSDVYLRTMYHFKEVKEITFPQLAKWAKIDCFIDRDTDRVVHLSADLPMMIRRKVVKVDAEARKLTIEEDQKEETLDLADDLFVWTPKGDAKLANITANRIVNCAFTLDRSKVQLLYLWDR